MIAITTPCLGDVEAAAAARVVRSGWVAQGPEVAAFEAEFAAYVGAPYACAVNSCTAALHMALVALDIGLGDEVITVSHSFIATANVVRQCGARPVFVDIDPATFNIDVCQLAAAIGPRTRAIVCVHQMGMPCDLAAILEVARAHDLRVIEDAACAAGSELLWQDVWQRIGRPHGDVACFSFHPRKVITTGEGGMLTTARPDLDRRFRLLRQHGMSIPDTVRHASRTVLVERYEIPGYNYRMTDIQAAIGRVQLDQLPRLVSERRRLAARYGELLNGLPGVGPPAEAPTVRSNWQSYCVRLPGDVDRHAVRQAMQDLGVATRPGIMCAHREPAYADMPARRPLLQSERAQDTSILLPLYPGMTAGEQDWVVEALAAAISAGRGQPAGAVVPIAAMPRPAAS